MNSYEKLMKESHARLIFSDWGRRCEKGSDTQAIDSENQVDTRNIPRKHTSCAARKSEVTRCEEKANYACPHTHSTGPEDARHRFGCLLR